MPFFALQWGTELLQGKITSMHDFVLFWLIVIFALADAGYQAYLRLTSLVVLEDKIIEPSIFPGKDLMVPLKEITHVESKPEGEQIPTRVTLSCIDHEGTERRVVIESSMPNLHGIAAWVRQNSQQAGSAMEPPK